MIRDVTVQSGERTNAAGKPVRNKILLSIPTKSSAQFAPTWNIAPFRVT